MTRNVALAAVGLILACSGSAVAQTIEECSSPGSFISSTVPPVVDSVTVGPAVIVTDVEVEVNLTHTFVGDLIIFVSSPEGSSLTLHNTAGGAADNMNLTFSDAGISYSASSLNCGCLMQPASGSFSIFDNEVGAGAGTLTVQDTLGGDVGTLNTWCLLLPSPIPPTDFVRGDVNGDLAVNTSDLIFILNAIFTPGSSQPGCEDAWYLAVVDAMAKTTCVQTACLSGLPWWEVDSPMDLADVRLGLAAARFHETRSSARRILARSSSGLLTQVSPTAAVAPRPEARTGVGLDSPEVRIAFEAETRGGPKRALGC